MDLIYKAWRGRELPIHLGQPNSLKAGLTVQWSVTKRACTFSVDLMVHIHWMISGSSQPKAKNGIKYKPRTPLLLVGGNRCWFSRTTSFCSVAFKTLPNRKMTFIFTSFPIKIGRRFTLPQIVFMIVLLPWKDKKE